MEYFAKRKPAGVMETLAQINIGTLDIVKLFFIIVVYFPAFRVNFSVQSRISLVTLQSQPSQFSKAIGDVIKLLVLSNQWSKNQQN